jgi:hypothetical protein
VAGFTGPAPFFDAGVVGLPGLDAPDFVGGVGAFDNQTLTAVYGLELHTLDFDITNQFCVWQTLVTAGAGQRYVDMRQDAAAVVLNNAGAVQAALDHRHSFRGIGPTLALEMLRPIGATGLSLYSNARGSIVFGTRNQDVVEFAEVIYRVNPQDLVDIVTAPPGAHRRKDRDGFR